VCVCIHACAKVGRFDVDKVSDEVGN
jgi:hypothetical protein